MSVDIAYVTRTCQAAPVLLKAEFGAGSGCRVSLLDTTDNGRGLPVFGFWQLAEWCDTVKAECQRRMEKGAS